MNPKKELLWGLWVDSQEAPSLRRCCAALATKLWRQLGAFEPLKNADPAEKAEFYKCSTQVKDPKTLNPKP